MSDVVGMQASARLSHYCTSTNTPAVGSLNGALFMHFWYSACGGGGGCVTAAFAHLKSRRRQSSKPGKWLCSSSAEAQEFFSEASVDTGLPVGKSNAVGFPLVV